MTPYFECASRIIRRFEGFRLAAYQCPAGVWTVGYGHTRDVLPDLRITEVEAERLLVEDMDNADQTVRRFCTAPLNDLQRGALISFVFNVGAGAFSRSTLLRRLNELDYAAVPAELLRWNKGGGRVLQGLILRREAEAQLFVAKLDEPHVAPVTKPAPAKSPLAEILGK
jgi:lysozyme